MEFFYSNAKIGLPETQHTVYQKKSSISCPTVVCSIVFSINFLFIDKE